MIVVELWVSTVSFQCITAVSIVFQRHYFMTKSTQTGTRTFRLSILACIGELNGCAGEVTVTVSTRSIRVVVCASVTYIQWFTVHMVGFTYIDLLLTVTSMAHLNWKVCSALNILMRWNWPTPEMRCRNLLYWDRDETGDPIVVILDFNVPCSNTCDNLAISREWQVLTESESYLMRSMKLLWSNFTNSKPNTNPILNQQLSSSSSSSSIYYAQSSTINQHSKDRMNVNGRQWDYKTKL